MKWIVLGIFATGAALLFLGYRSSSKTSNPDDIIAGALPSLAGAALIAGDVVLVIIYALYRLFASGGA